MPSDHDPSRRSLLTVLRFTNVVRDGEQSQIFRTRLVALWGCCSLLLESRVWSDVDINGSPDSLLVHAGPTARKHVIAKHQIQPPRGDCTCHATYQINIERRSRPTLPLCPFLEVSYGLPLKFVRAVYPAVTTGTALGPHTYAAPHLPPHLLSARRCSAETRALQPLSATSKPVTKRIWIPSSLRLLSILEM